MQTIKEWLHTPEITELRKKPVYEVIETGFHRERIVPIKVNKEVLFSPANGILLYAKKIASKDDIIMVHGTPVTLKDLVRKELYEDEFIIFGIFMTFYDIHTNYMPSSGYIVHEKLQELRIDNLSMTKVEMEILQEIDHPDTGNMEYLFYNERMLNTVFDNDIGQEYYIVQIADAEVGAIIPFHEQDYFVAQGWPFSAVRFGSQVDLIVPIKKGKTYEILVDKKIGWHIDAVLDPLIRVTTIEETTPSLDPINPVMNFNECHDDKGQFCSGDGAEAVEFISTSGSGFVNPAEGAIKGYGEITTQSRKKKPGVQCEKCKKKG